MSTRPKRPDATELLLRHLFRRATLTAMAAAAVPIAGCQEEGLGAGVSRDAAPPDGGSLSDAGLDATLPPQPPVLLDACTDHARTLSAEGITPRTPVDYLAIRQRYGDPSGADPASAEWTAQDFTVLSETGSACAAATTDDCAQQIAKHPFAFTSTGSGQAPMELSVVTTAGDVVSHYAGVKRLKELFGDVDTLDEASLLVSSGNRFSTCGGRIGAQGERLIYATSYTQICTPIVQMIYELRVELDGQIIELRSEELLREEQACVGRRPAGLASGSPAGVSGALADYLAACAHLEAASVVAFEQLAEDLQRLGAPQALVQRAREAAEDERRHARVVATLARARGAHCPPVRTHAMDARDLEAIASENAVEGCVRETFGVLVGAHQALRAEARDVADAMVPIVRDETRHAALSWDVHAWAMASLSPEARSRVHRRQAAAVDALGRQVRRGNSPELTRLAGTPTAAVQTAMFEQLRRTLWS